MENKKTKLTISGNPKKTLQNFSQSKPLGKKTVFIDKQLGKNSNKGSYKKNDVFKKSPNFKKNALSQSKLFTKPPQFTSDFEKRKLAEQRATKRLKADTENKDKKSKLGTKKREMKLTVSRALSDEIEIRERSLASVK